jgi:hypothetical protein
VIEDGNNGGTECGSVELSSSRAWLDVGNVVASWAEDCLWLCKGRWRRDQLA